MKVDFTEKQLGMLKGMLHFQIYENLKFSKENESLKDVAETNIIEYKQMLKEIEKCLN